MPVIGAEIAASDGAFSGALDGNAIRGIRGSPSGSPVAHYGLPNTNGSRELAYTTDLGNGSFKCIHPPIIT